MENRHRHLSASVCALMALAILPASGPCGAEVDVCDESLVPVVWPLGLERFESRRLLYSHAQFEQHDSFAANVHRGIDIAGSRGEYVYAVQDGIVDYCYDDSGSGYGYLQVRDADVPDGSIGLGWKYMHMKNFKVKPGKTVLRDQVLGEVAKFPKANCFDHVHLQRLIGNAPLDEYAKDAGNALPLLPSRADGVPPQRKPFESPIPTGAGFLFYKDGTHVVAGPTPTAGTPVDIVARVAETFHGSSTPACPIAACAGPVGAPDLAPMRLSLSIFEEKVQTSTTGAPLRTKVEPVFTNTIDLRIAVKDSAEGADLAGRIYDDESRGDYDDRYLLVVMTNCQTSGTGAFTFASKGKYLLQLLLEDASGNATSFERRIELP